MSSSLRHVLRTAAVLLPLAGAPAALAFYHGAAAPAAAATTVEVTLAEWRIDVSTTRLAPGRVVFRITNAGRYPHAFEIEAEAPELEHRSRTLGAGETVEFAVELPPGRYRLEAYCPIPGHRERGMATELEVG